MASILHQIATPLQFVALFILLLAGVARMLVRSGKGTASPSTERLVIDRIFQAALAALLLGLLIPTFAPILDRWLSGDEVFHGAVLSATGDPVPDATVNLIGVATVPTNALGQFDMTVPRNRLQKDYKLQVKASGYETSAVLPKTGEDLKNVEVRLTPAQTDLLKSLESPLYVGQYYGVPFVIATLRAENVGNAPVYIREIRGTLKSKDASLVLSPFYWTIAPISGPYAPMNGWLPILAKSTVDLHLFMATGANYGALFSQVSQLAEYKAQAPCVKKFDGNVDPLTANAFKIVKAFADEHFVWTSGDWRLELEVTTDNEAKDFNRDFALSAGDVDHLKASIALLGRCLGVNPVNPLGQDGGLANFLSK
jgi:hypothetical protein